EPALCGAHLCLPRRLRQVPPLLVETGNGVREQVPQGSGIQRGALGDLLGPLFGGGVHRCLDTGRRPVHESAQRRGVVADVREEMPARPRFEQGGTVEFLVGHLGQALRQVGRAAPGDEESLGQVEIVESHGRLLLFDDRLVPDGAEALDGDLADLAVADVARGLAGVADTAGGAGDDDVTGLQGPTPGNVRLTTFPDRRDWTLFAEAYG